VCIVAANWCSRKAKPYFVNKREPGFSCDLVVRHRLRRWVSACELRAYLQPVPAKLVAGSNSNASASAGLFASFCMTRHLQIS
jgi:hypothetical protein